MIQGWSGGVQLWLQYTHLKTEEIASAWDKWEKWVVEKRAAEEAARQAARFGLQRDVEKTFERAQQSAVENEVSAQEMSEVSSCRASS